jgi:mitochondrial distribution and morphology protein 12
MSVDIQWDSIISGPDGAALAEKIRVFVHEKFQQVPLPRFINAVHVHSFDLGTVSPEIEIKDICDPLPDFYEDEDDEEEHDRAGSEPPSPPTRLAHAQGGDHHDNRVSESVMAAQRPQQLQRPLNILTGPDVSRSQAMASTKEGIGLSANPFSGPFPRSTTPGIPGGTSNLSYFHFPGTGLSGTQTPLAAVASGSPFTPRPWSYDPSENPAMPSQGHLHEPTSQTQPHKDYSEHHDPSTRPSTANSISSVRESESEIAQQPHPAPGQGGVRPQSTEDASFDSVSALSPSRLQSRQPSDLQVVTRVRYAGDVRMTLTAEILLDYPMPSFVGIPLKLAITGLNFDGVAIVAWVKKKMNFCFLDPEDAAALVGEDLADDRPKEKRSKDGSVSSMSGLLQEIHVESEIGRQADGKQVLKNVGKVEKFVLEQVRKIFEEEFVFPSYWTFLI